MVLITYSYQVHLINNANNVSYLFSCPIECVYNFFFFMVRHISKLYRYEGKKSAYNLVIRAMMIPMQLATKIEKFYQFG